LGRVVEKLEVRTETVNYDAVETSSKNRRVSRNSSMRSTSDSSTAQSAVYTLDMQW